MAFDELVEGFSTDRAEGGDGGAGRDVLIGSTSPPAGHERSGGRQPARLNQPRWGCLIFTQAFERRPHTYRDAWRLATTPSTARVPVAV